jgi:hypothetical protein
MMSYQSSCTALCTMFVVLGCHSSGTPSFDNEVLLAIDRWSGVAKVAAGEASEDVQADINEFIHAIQELDIPPSDLNIASSPDGRAIWIRDRRFLHQEQNPAWIWPSWREPERVLEIDHCSPLYFASSNYVVCGSDLIDIHSGSKRQLPAEWFGWRVFKTDESGKWWAVRTRSGSLLVGSLDDGLSSDRPPVLENLGDYEGPEFFGASPFVAAFSRDGLHIIDVRSRTTVFTTGVVEPNGAIYRAGASSIIVRDWLVSIETNNDGDFEAAAVRKIQMRRAERGARPSPSGKHVAVFQDLLWPPSGVTANVVSTPLSRADDHRGRLRLSNQLTFSFRIWLSWQGEND